MSSEQNHRISRKRTSDKSYDSRKLHRNSSSSSNISSHSHHTESGHSLSRHKHKSRSRHGKRHHHKSHHEISKRTKSSASNDQKLQEHKTCFSGPGLFTNVLGPTADESFLIGLQTILGFCTTRNEEQLSNQSVVSFGSHQQIEGDQDSHHSEEKHSTDTISQPELIAEPAEPTFDTQESEIITAPVENPPVGEVTEILNDLLQNVEPAQQSTQIFVEEEIAETFANPSTDTNTIKSIVSTGPKEYQRSGFRNNSFCPCVTHCVCVASRQSRSEKSSSTSEFTMSSIEMRRASEHSSQTDNPSQETRPSQTSSQKKHAKKKSCICKVIAEETNSEPSFKTNQHCSCAACCNKRRSKQTRRQKPCFSKNKTRCVCSSPNVPAKNKCSCSSTDTVLSAEDDSTSLMKNGQLGVVRYAITKITKFCSYTTFEIMKSTKKKPKIMPSSVEGVFVLKNTEK